MIDNTSPPGSHAQHWRDTAAMRGQTVFTVPYPPADLSPNKRLHWRASAKAKKLYREQCWVAALKVRPNARKGRVTLELDFYPPDRRKRDDDNALASFKAGRDGIADALGIDDSKFRTGFMLHDYDPARPDGCVEVTIC